VGCTQPLPLPEPLEPEPVEPPDPPLEPEPLDPEPFDPEPLDPEPLDPLDPEPPEPFDPELPEPEPLDPVPPDPDPTPPLPELPPPPSEPFLPLSPLPPSSRLTVTGGGAPTTTGGPLVGSSLGSSPGVDGIPVTDDAGVIDTAGAPKGWPASSAKLRPLVSSTASVAHVPATSPSTSHPAAVRGRGLPAEGAAVEVAPAWSVPAGALAGSAVGVVLRKALCCSIGTPLDSASPNSPVRRAAGG